VGRVVTIAGTQAAPVAFVKRSSDAAVPQLFNPPAHARTLKLLLHNDATFTLLTAASLIRWCCLASLSLFLCSHQVPRLRTKELRRLSSHERTVNRAYGGSRCAACVRERIMRAFIIEEQKIVKKVLAEKRKAAPKAAAPAAPAATKAAAPKAAAKKAAK
jgi:hypothetical protein